MRDKIRIDNQRKRNDQRRQQNVTSIERNKKAVFDSAV
jgi:hypothetical protein